MFQALLLAASVLLLQTPAARTWTQADLEAVSGKIREDIEAQRGMKFVRPVQVKVADRKGFLDYARKRREKTETPERRARDETIAKMLGLIPPDMDLEAAIETLLEEQVGGFYDPGEDTFYLIETFGGDLARIILAHELTHALDDQLFDLDGGLKKLGQRTDAEFAFQALVEGSGTSAMNQWTVQHLKDLDKKALLDSADLGTKGLESAPQFLWKPLIAAYLRGESFLVRVEGMNMAMKAATAEDVRAAFKNPPRSSEQILHPAKYWDPKEADEPRPVEVDLSRLPAGWKAAGDDTLGELYLALVTTPPGERKPFDPKNPFAIIGIDYTNEAAKGWGGDRAVLLEKGDARILWLVTAWDRPEDAQEFRKAAGELAARSGDGPYKSRVEPESDAAVVVLVVSRGVPDAEVIAPAWKLGAR